MDEGYGALAAALAKAQAAFPPITRDKTVTVQTRQKPDGSGGGSYTFKYAPLDSILNATRKPLSDNGLAVLQLLDEDVLVTSLLHSSGAILSGRTPIPAAEGIQAYGSAITYLRRYAIQALLGIAAEEDDDGNAAAGNRATFGGRSDSAVYSSTNPPPAPPDPMRDGLIGTAEKTDKMTGDYSIRNGSDHLSDEPDVVKPMLGFRLRDGSPSGFLCEAWGPLATALALVESDVIGHRVQVWGRFVQRPLQKGGSYRAFVVERLQSPTLILPAQEAPSLPLFDLDPEIVAAADAA